MLYYVVFAYGKQTPSGGMDDYEDKFDSIHIAVDKASQLVKDVCDVAQIVRVDEDGLTLLFRVENLDGYHETWWDGRYNKLGVFGPEDYLTNN